MAARDPQHAPSRRYVYLAHERIADLLALTGDPTGAIEHYRQSQAITESLLAADQANWHLRRHLAVLRGKIATLLAERGEMAEALEQSRLSHATFEALYNSDPANADARHILASSHGQRGQIFAAARRTAEALAHCREQLTLLEGLFAADRANTVWHFELAGALHALAALYAPAGQTAEARRLTVRALGLQKGLAERTHATATDLHLYARALLTAEPAELRDPAAALPHARRAVEMTRGTIPALLDTLALAYHLTGDHARAVTTAEQGLALLKPDAPARRDFAARLAKFKAAAKGQP
jgi:tetratricopeptide (TPR) repeat protein